MQAIAVPKLTSTIQARAEHIASCFLSKGFPYVKVELEANVQPDNYSGQSECFACSGSGRMTCGMCGGAGTTWTRCSTCNEAGTIEAHHAQPRPCSDCCEEYRETPCEECSDGYVDCEECRGRGYFECDDWVDGYLDDFWDSFSDRLGAIEDRLKYSRIYHDGSVDTEVTLTLGVDHIRELPVIIGAFRETCREFGSCGTGNAGLHITLLPDHVYPRKEKLDEKKLTNFRRQVSKLLLGLVCLGSPGDSTRAFEFRDLAISSDVKYSAIFTHRDTCLEYRLFDACFDRPSYIIRYLELISRTLDYYTEKPRRIQKLRERLSLKESDQLLNKAYRGRHRKLVDVFRTDESIARLFKELAYFVKRRSRLWLTFAYRWYTLGLITKQELFSGLVTELKGGA